jgi:hypothetical protein
MKARRSAKAQRRTYYDPDDTADRQGKFSPEGISRPPAALRADLVIAEGFKRMPVDTDDRTHSSVRGVIARLRLSPARLAHLASLLGMHAAGVASPPPDMAQRWGYREVAFYCYRAALSLLVETAPRSRQDLGDLLPVLLIWPGALPPSQQAKVASIIGAHIADVITGRPFRRRSLVARRGAR